MPYPRLFPGAHIRLVSPASPLAADRLEFATNLLTNDGFRVSVAPHALDSDHYLAGSDADRAADLTDAFLDPNVHAVLCTRGGYGCARIMPLLDLDALAATGKLLAGFSDITTLHLAFNRRGVPTLHSPMPLTLHFPREPWVQESFLRALKGDFAAPVEAPKATTLVPGIVQGETVGGCLCLLADSIGTPDPLIARDKILVIEDVDEAPHRVDAMLTHLLRSRTLEGVRGIVVGEMTRSDDRIDAGIGGIPWREIVRDRLAPLGVPLVTDFPFGHCPQMLSIPLGVPATLDADGGTLSFDAS